MTAISAHRTATEADDDVMIHHSYVCFEGSNSASSSPWSRPSSPQQAAAASSNVAMFRQGYLLYLPLFRNPQKQRRKFSDFGGHYIRDGRFSNSADSANLVW